MVPVVDIKWRVGMWLKNLQTFPFNRFRPWRQLSNFKAFHIHNTLAILFHPLKYLDTAEPFLWVHLSQSQNNLPEYFINTAHCSQGQPPLFQSLIIYSESWDGVQIGGIVESGAIEQGEPNGERLCQREVGFCFSEAEMQISDFLWRQISHHFLEDCFLVVVELVGPGVLTSHLCLSIIVDENISWLRISYLFATTMQSSSCLHQTQS